jgi:hypothetical protein
MANLTSPGVEVSVINESFYVPSDAGTTPLFIVASSQDKQNGAGDGTAVGTTTANANTAYLISSQRELTETFGDPKFYTDASGNSLNGYELNEYGLQAAYSFLGVANRAFVLRANVNTAELVGSASRPTARPDDGTYWFDLASSSYGLFEWSKTDQKFTAVTPTLITALTDLVGGVSTGIPKTSVGVTGDYAINTTHVSNKIYKKTASNTWVQVGSTSWHESLPIITVASGTTVTTKNMKVNGITITSGGTALSDVATAIGSNVTNVSASVNSITGDLEIFHNGKALGDSAAGTNTIRFEEGNGLLAELGITAGIYNGVKFLQDKHTNRPTWDDATTSEDRPNGSVWFKTTSANSGANLIAKLYSSSSASFSQVASPLHSTHNSAIFNLDPAGGGANLSVGDLYVQFNITEESMTAADATDATPNVGDFQFFRYEGGTTKVTSNSTAPTFTSSETFVISESRKNQEAMSTAVTITLGGTGADDFVAAVNAKVDPDAAATTTTKLINVKASKLSTGEIVIEHLLGGEIRMFDTLGTPLADAGFSQTTAHAYGSFTANSSTLLDNLYDIPTGATIDSTANTGILASNWKRLSYTASTSSPTNEPADGTLWYHTATDEADILAHNGTTFIGYLNAYSNTDPNGPQFSATAPTTQSDGTALVTNDLWIDTSDLENYPKLYKYNTAATLSSTNTSNQVAVTTSGAAWELVDKTDQTTEDGIVFADARLHTSAEKADSLETGGAGDSSSIKDLLSDNFLDPDAPNPDLFPQGILLWNTRRSGYNVKEYKNNYITTTKYPGSGSAGLGNIRQSNESVATYFPDRWVTKSSNNADGSGSFGRKAQRKVVVEQLKSEIDTNQAIREDQRGYNVIACPGYPELIANMINLNTDRNNTSFVVGDTPLRLEGTSTAIQNYANNTAGALDNGEDGLVSSSDFLGMFYPSGQTTDNTGKTIVVPPSHMMLRTLANNDSVAFPWFAPSGTRRGVVDNATAVGHIDASTGEFKTISVTESVRDSMHEVKINPITFFAGAGIVNFGNLTKTSASSALDRINVSRLAVFLRSQLNSIAKPFIFEPNDELTRNEIKGAIESFLLELTGQRALFDFLVVCDETNNTPTRIDRNELYVDIAIEPIKSVEFIYIPLRIKNTGEIAKLGQ